MITWHAANQTAVYVAPFVECDFPGCHALAHPGSSMCVDHLLVRMSGRGSWVDDRHADGGHG